MIICLLIAITACQEEDSGLFNKHFSLTLQPDSTTGKDAMFSYIVPDNNYGTIADIDLYSAMQSGSLNVSRFAIDFDLSSIPGGANIDSAFLSLYFNKTSIYGNNHNGDNYFLIQRITSTWSQSTITWRTQPKTTTWNQILMPKPTLPTQDYKNINITSLLQDMVDDKANSYGLLFKLHIEEPGKILLFASSNNLDENSRPKLVVYYSVME